MTDVDVSRTDLDGFTGAVIRPQDAGYPAARRVWKGMIDRYPSMIVRPESSDDVAIAVTFARDRGLPLAIRGGGHNVAGSGVCDRGVVIDLRELRGVAVDPVARTVTGGGGCTWGEFDAAAAEHGLATTGGLISSTGVGGLTLGGGIGWLARRYGFSSDNLRRAEVVTADGRIVVADDDTNPDLFWALRGGGGNFGVVTELTFHAHPVDTVLGGILLYRSERAAEILAQYATWAAGIPDEMATLATFLTAPPEPVVPPELRGRPAFAVVLCHLGDHTQGRVALDRLRAAAPPTPTWYSPCRTRACNGCWTPRPCMAGAATGNPATSGALGPTCNGSPSPRPARCHHRSRRSTSNNSAAPWQPGRRARSVTATRPTSSTSSAAATMPPTTRQ